MTQKASFHSSDISSWVTEHGDELYSWAVYKVKDKAKAEDLVQDTFLSALSSIANFEGKSSPKTWLMSILKHKIIDHYRSVSKQMEQFKEGENSSAFTLTEGMFDRSNNWKANGLESFWEDEKHLLDNAGFNSVFEVCMHDLPPSWYVSVTAKYMLEKQAPEICKELDITPSNYWQVIHRAKLLLKKCLEKNWFEKA